jgi:hypothetical protein
MGVSMKAREQTEIVLLAARRCFSIALMISRTDGSKRVSTSDLSTMLNKTRGKIDENSPTQGVSVGQTGY